MVVVFHHIGTPNTSIITQNEKITNARSRMLSGFSGGGSFFFVATDTAFAGASSSPALIAGSSATAGDAAEPAAVADMLVLPIVAFVHA
jgi:hypothetical protein